MPQVPLRKYYLYELANLYNVSVYIMRKDLALIRGLGKPTRGYGWDRKQVRKIFTHLDWPEILV